MSTILDALRKLQRERSAQSPSKDLRGSVTTETPISSRARPRGGAVRWIVLALAIVGLAGGGYWLQQSGKLEALSGGLFAKADAPPAAPAEIAPAGAASPTSNPAKPDRRARPPHRPAPAANPPPANVVPAEPPPQASPPPAPAETPETAAERARLEAALANARAAQEAQRREEREAAAQLAAVKPPTPSPPPEPAPVPAARTTAPPAKAAPPAPPVVTAKPKSEPAKPRVASPPPVRPAESAPPSSSFPDVRVESIRWHPSPERRVASLEFEQQNAPEAREGDIVAGVLVYRIDPGSVELRVGSAQRTVSPGP